MITKLIIRLLRWLLRDQPQAPEFHLGDNIIALATIKTRRNGTKTDQFDTGSAVHAGLEYTVAGTYRQKDSGTIYVMRKGAMVPLPDAFPATNFRIA
jgi:hypothetical protein